MGMQFNEYVNGTNQATNGRSKIIERLTTIFHSLFFSTFTMQNTATHNDNRIHSMQLIRTIAMEHKNCRKLSIWYSDIIISEFRKIVSSSFFHRCRCFWMPFFRANFIVCVYHSLRILHGIMNAQKRPLIEIWLSLFRAKAYQIGPLHRLLFFSNAHNFLRYAILHIFSLSILWTSSI